jgi:hypothetical protein
LATAYCQRARGEAKVYEVDEKKVDYIGHSLSGRLSILAPAKRTNQEKELDIDNQHQTT